MTKKERWKEVSGYGGVFKVSSKGKVLSKKRNGTNGGILTGKVSKFGYRVMLLSHNSIKKHVFAHRIVAEAFIPNPENLPFVNHKDEDKLNNSVENLEWCTTKYNLNYGTLPERRSKARLGFKYSESSKRKMSESQNLIAKRGSESPYSIEVYQFTLEGDFVGKWDSYSDIKRVLGYGPTNINISVKNKLRTAYGFKWSIIPPDENLKIVNP